jgi:hypothetical protein
LTALRSATVALGLCVAVLAGFEGRALADGPGPEPAPPPPPALQPDPAPSAQPKPGGSSTSTSTPQTSFPAAVAPTPQSVASPPPAAVRPTATAPARKQQTRRIVSTSSRPHKSSAVNRVMRFPGLIFARTPFRAISGQEVAASTSRESRLLLVGGLALVLLVIGETTFLALAGARLGFRQGRRSRHRKPA